VLVVMARTLYFFKDDSVYGGLGKNVVHGTAIEIIWTVIPSVILIIIALPSFALLYSIDEIIDTALTLKCVGHQ
jgi:cytochrome c oxidase subunit 2